MDTFVTGLALAVLVGSMLMAGTFFAFSNFVMKALAGLPAAHGAAAMQSINRVVLNPLFLAAFAGTALVAIALAGVSMIEWRGAEHAWYVAAAACYGLGTFAVTVTRNVPLNEALARAGTDEAGVLWPHYVARWVPWNHVRTVAAVLAVLACTAGLAEAARAG